MDFLGTLAIGVEVLGVKRRKALERQLEIESKQFARLGIWTRFWQTIRPPKGKETRSFQQRVHIRSVAAVAYVFTIILTVSLRDHPMVRFWFDAVGPLPILLSWTTVLLVIPALVLVWAVALNRPTSPKNPGIEWFLAIVSVITMATFYPVLFAYAMALLTMGALTTLATAGVNRLLLYSFRLKKKHNLPSALAVSGLILVTLGFLIQLFVHSRP